MSEEVGQCRGVLLCFILLFVLLLSGVWMACLCLCNPYHSAFVAFTVAAFEY